MPEAISIAVPKGEGSTKAAAENVSYYWKAKRESPEGKLFNEMRAIWDMDESFIRFLKYLKSLPPPAKQ